MQFKTCDEDLNERRGCRPPLGKMPIGVQVVDVYVNLCDCSMLCSLLPAFDVVFVFDVSHLFVHVFDVIVLPEDVEVVLAIFEVVLLVVDVDKADGEDELDG